MANRTPWSYGTTKVTDPSGFGILGYVDKAVKVLDGSVLAKAEDVEELSTRVESYSEVPYSLSGAGKNKVECIIPCNDVGTRKIKFTSSVPWNVESIETDYVILSITTQDADGNTLSKIATVMKNDTEVPSLEYSFELPENCNDVRVMIRADIGTSVDFKFGGFISEQVSEIKEEIKDLNENISGKSYTIEGADSDKVETLIPCDGAATKKIKFSSIPWNVDGVKDDNVILSITTKNSDGETIETIATVKKNGVDPQYEYTIKVTENCSYIRVMIRASAGTNVTFFYGSYIADQINDLQNKIDGKPESEELVYEGEKITIAQVHGYRKTYIAKKSDVMQGVSAALQGMAIYDDSIIVQASAGDKDKGTTCKLFLYDLQNNNGLGVIDFKDTSIQYFHGNSISLGSKYDETDPIPLVFFSGARTRQCAVVRVKSDYTAEIVSVITYNGNRFPSDSESERYAISFTFDSTNGHLVLYHPISATGVYTTKARACEYELPTLTESVSMDDSGFIAEYLTDCVYMHQQLISAYGKLFALSGYAPSGWEPCIVVIDKGCCQKVSKIHLADYREPEGISLYGYNSIVVQGSVDSGTAYYEKLDF